MTKSEQLQKAKESRSHVKCYVAGCDEVRQMSNVVYCKDHQAIYQRMLARDKSAQSSDVHDRMAMLEVLPRWREACTGRESAGQRDLEWAVARVCLSPDDLAKIDPDTVPSLTAITLLQEARANPTLLTRMIRVKASEEDKRRARGNVDGVDTLKLIEDVGKAYFGSDWKLENDGAGHGCRFVTADA